MDKDQAKTLFESCDQDGSGYVDKEEFITMMFKHFKIEGENEQISSILDDIFTMVDGKGLFNRKNGKLNFKEFYNVVSLLPEKFVSPMRSCVYVLFRLVDKDNSGDVSRKELKTYFSKIGVEMKSKELKDLVGKLDKDGSNEIEFEEFMSLFN